MRCWSGLGLSVCYSEFRVTISFSSTLLIHNLCQIKREKTDFKQLHSSRLWSTSLYTTTSKNILPTLNLTLKVEWIETIFKSISRYQMCNLSQMCKFSIRKNYDHVRHWTQPSESRNDGLSLELGILCFSMCCKFYTQQEWHRLISVLKHLNPFFYQIL